MYRENVINQARYALLMTRAKKGLRFWRAKLNKQKETDLNKLTLSGKHPTMIYYEKKMVLIIVFFSFVFRLMFLSPWLGDWDSVLFSLSLHKFSLIEHLPQPPGYILYVFLGRMTNLIFRNDTLSLTFLSALLGSVLLIPFYFLTKKIAGKIPAVIATILVSITPIHVLSSITVFSEIPGQFFSILSAYLIYKGKSSNNFLLLGSFLAGISLGVRFAEFTTVISLIVVVLLFKKNFLHAIKSVVSFLAGILIWFVPLIITTGWPDFIKAYITQATYIFNHDSIVGYSSLASRFSQVGKLFLTGYTPFFIPVIVIVVIYFLKNKRMAKKFDNVFILVWLFSYLIPLLFVYNLEVTRFVLPLLPPISILFAISIKSLIKNNIFKSFLIVLIVPIFLSSIDVAYRVKNIIPPTVTPVLYVKDHFSANDTTLVTSYIFRQFQYYSPEFVNFFSSSTSYHVQSEYLITDYIGLKDKIDNIEDFQLIDQKDFEGPKDIFSRLSKTSLYIYKKIQN